VNSSRPRCAIVPTSLPGFHFYLGSLPSALGHNGVGEWNQSDSRAMRRLIPYNGIFYARKPFDEAEPG
jgi:hypothetical protein